MVTLFQLFRRAPDLTRAEFQQHFLDRYARHGRNDSAVRKYNQYHAFIDEFNLITHSVKVTPPKPYDGAAAMDFDNVESAHRALAGKHFLAARAEEPMFVDRDGSTMALLKGHDVIALNSDAPIVYFEVWKRRSDMDWATADKLWYRHGEISALLPTIVGYTQYHHAIPDESGIPDLPASAKRLDGVVVANFYSIAEMKFMLQQVKQLPVEREDEVIFTDPDLTVRFPARCHLVKH